MPNGVPADTHMTPLGMITLVELTKLHEKHRIVGLFCREWRDIICRQTRRSMLRLYVEIPSHVNQYGESERKPARWSIV